MSPNHSCVQIMCSVNMVVWDTDLWPTNVWTGLLRLELFHRKIECSAVPRCGTKTVTIPEKNLNGIGYHVNNRTGSRSDPLTPTPICKMNNEYDKKKITISKRSKLGPPNRKWCVQAVLFNKKNILSAKNFCLHSGRFLKTL